MCGCRINVAAIVFYMEDTDHSSGKRRTRQVATSGLVVELGLNPGQPPLIAILGCNGGADMRCHHLGRLHVLLKESKPSAAKILALGWA